MIITIYYLDVHRQILAKIRSVSTQLNDVKHDSSKNTGKVGSNVYSLLRYFTQMLSHGRKELRSLWRTKKVIQLVPISYRFSQTNRII